jgi:hypothetical protein
MVALQGMAMTVTGALFDVGPPAHWAVLGMTCPTAAPPATWPVQFKVRMSPGLGGLITQVMVEPLTVQPAVQVTKVMPVSITSVMVTVGDVPLK